MAIDLKVGDVITIGNDPSVPPDYEWRVTEYVPGKGFRLRPAGASARDDFNDAAGEFWIAGPEDEPFPFVPRDVKRFAQLLEGSDSLIPMQTRARRQDDDKPDYLLD